MSKGHKCTTPAVEVSLHTVKTVKQNVFSCVLKVLTEVSVDRSSAGRLFDIDGPQTAKLLSPQDVLVR